jgi:hypothetical protein
MDRVIYDRHSGGMGKSDLMDRVANDLARGHTYPAIQRMHSLIAAHPTDLDLRRRLAAIYRAVGNAVEAGRWSYLDDNAVPGELAAFERTFPSHRRLEALRWPLEAMAPTDTSRERLAPLLAERPAPIRTLQAAGSREIRDRLLTVGAVAALMTLALLTIVGARTAMGWLF